MLRLEKATGHKFCLVIQAWTYRYVIEVLYFPCLQTKLLEFVCNVLPRCFHRSADIWKQSLLINTHIGAWVGSSVVNKKGLITKSN